MTDTNQKPLDLVFSIMEYESGNMDNHDVIAFFQRLYDTGALNHLQGHYGRTFAALLDAGFVHTHNGA